MKQQNKSIRIISGKWRGRWINFDGANVRPTANRIRETLFNWLAPIICDSCCLDLFAGSGILSFEALSRGAAQVTAIDQDQQACSKMLENKKNLQDINLKIINQDVLFFLSNFLSNSKKHNNFNNSNKYNIIFLDPPYDKKNILFKSCELLELHSWLNKDTVVYFESNQDINHNNLPVTWKIKHKKKAGQVWYYLACQI